MDESSRIIRKDRSTIFTRRSENEKIYVTTREGGVSVSKKSFRLLLDNSVAGSYSAYQGALETGRITLKGLQDLAHRGEIPLPLFFAPEEVVEAQVKHKLELLLRGLSQRDTFRIGSRETIRLGDIDLLLRDLLRKQEQLRKVDKTLVKNPVMGKLGDPRRPPEELANTLKDLIGFSPEHFRAIRTKRDALEYFVDCLEAKQIFVSRSVHREFMPQAITKSFSGMTVKDNKIPYIFLPGGDPEEGLEPAGRRIFTLTLLAVLVAEKRFATVSWNHGDLEDEHLEGESGRTYDVAGAFLMPKSDLAAFHLEDLPDIEAASNAFHVTPSAVVVRAARTGLLSWMKARYLLDELQSKRSTASPQHGRRPPQETSVARYAGAEFVRRMLTAQDAGLLSPTDFRLYVTLNRLEPSQFSDLRRVVSS